MIVIYHKNCADGFCAAWLIHQIWPDAEYIAAQHGEPVPLERVKEQDVVMVDFSYKFSGLVELAAYSKSLVVLDHHKTAQLDINQLVSWSLENEANVRVRFDLNQSGATLAYHWLADMGYYLKHPYASDWAGYVKDRDLWTWKLPDSRAVSAYLSLIPFEFDAWDMLPGPWTEEVIDKGRAVLTYQEQLITRAVGQAVMGSVAGYNVPIVNATTLISEVGEALCKGRSFSATWFDTYLVGKGWHRIWSLRSEKNAIDVGEVARKLGGGGHPNAAGFQVLIDCPDEGVMCG